MGTDLSPDVVAGAAEAAAAESEPFTDAVATDWYRRRMVELFVGRSLTGLAPGPARTEG